VVSPKRVTRSLAVTLAILLAADAAAGAAPWVEVKTPSFTVVSDAGEKEARRIALHFEQMRALLKELWPWARFDPSRPITILAARDEDSFRQLLPAYWEQKGRARPDGLFTRRPDRNWVALRTDMTHAVAFGAWRNPFLPVVHEYVHLVLHLNFPALPVWLDEGLADLWGNTIIEDDRIQFGHFIPEHINTLHGGARLPVSKLLAVGRSAPEYNEQSRATIFYAESWALVHYLTFGERTDRGQQPAAERPLNRLVARLKEGEAPAEAEREVLGDPAALDRELDTYLKGLRLQYERRPMTVRVDTSAWTSRPLPVAESFGLRAAFHAAMGRATEARAMAAEALKLDAGCALAQETLAVTAFRQHQWAEALRALGSAVELPGASDYVHYLYGRLRWDEAQDQATLEAVERSFARAVEINASYAEAYDALARVMAARGASPEKTFPLAARAAQLEPMVVEYKITALLLAASGGDVEGARRQAQALLERSPADDRPKLTALIRRLETKAPDAAIPRPQP
jgi:tetratricopeptide (TPR) repeat protein